MSQLRKSASFRSRIPVRERLPQRRCSSPQPISTLKSRQSKTNSKPFYDRYCSSSSFSSSDESHESEKTLQSLLKKSATTPANTNMMSRLNGSTDAFSVNGLLDNVSSGSFSTQNSPQSTVNREFQDSKAASNAERNLFRAPLSSYESLDKFNCTSETLKITDDYHQQKHNIINTMDHEIPTCEIISTNILEQKTVSPIKHQLQSTNNNYRLMSAVADDAYNKTSSMKRRSNHNDYDSIVNADDNEQAVNKQKHLSDWYYIKSSPKQKPASPYERCKAKNFPPNPPLKPVQPKVLLAQSEMLNNTNSSDKISSLNGESPFIPIQKYRSNDYIEHHPHQQLQQNQQEQQQQFPYEEKSPLQSYKCFSMKYSKNPSGRSSETKFGEMTSSSFEHVNVTGLYDNRFSESDPRNDDYVQSLPMAAAKMRPLPPSPATTTNNNQESQITGQISSPQRKPEQWHSDKFP